MHELIHIQPRDVGGASIQTVNARDLWQFVESQQQFADWIKARIETYGFIENEDWVIHKTMKNPAGGRPALDYHLSVEMAKELAMVENNDKGREIRRYFIECERRAKSVDPLQALNDPAAMRGILLNYTEKVLSLQAKVEEQAPKVAALDRIATFSDGSFCIRDAAKSLQIPERRLQQLMLERQWVYRRPMGAGLLAYSDKLQSGLMEHKITRGERPDGSEWVGTQARVTAKGMAKLATVIAESCLQAA